MARLGADLFDAVPKSAIQRTAKVLFTRLETRGKDPYGNPAFVNDLLEKRLGRKTGKRTGRRLSLPGYPLRKEPSQRPDACTSPDNSRYARKIFPSIIPVVVPAPVRSSPGNSDVVVPTVVVPTLPGNSDGGVGP